MADKNGVKLINPAELTYNPEDLVMYFELTAFRRGKSLFVNNLTTNEIRTEANGSSQRLSLMGYDEESGYYTTNWINEDPENNENFGIESVRITQNASMVMTVDVVFRDVRGKSIRTAGENSPYAVLFDLPQAFYEMKVKGYFGKSLNIKLIPMSLPDISHMDDGDMQVKMKFTSYTFAILRGINIDYIKSARLLEEHLSGTDNIQYEATADDSQNPTVTSVLDLIERSKDITTEIRKLNSDNEFSEELKKIQRELDLYTELANKRTNVINFAVSKDVNGQYSQETDDLIFATSSDSSDNKLNKDIQKRIDEFLRFKEENNLLSEVKLKSVKADLSAILGDGIKGILIKDGNKKFIDKLNKKLATLKDREKKVGDKVNQIIDEGVQKILGFRPTIRNVMSVILADADKFYNLFKDTCRKAETYHRENNTANRDNVDYNYDQIYAFPTYVEERTISNLDPQKNETDTIVDSSEAYPGKLGIYEEWPEVQFVEAYLQSKVSIQSREVGQRNAAKTANEKEIRIYSSPVETTNQYMGVNNSPDLLLQEIVRRYVALKHYSYGNTPTPELSRFIARNEAYAISQDYLNTTALASLQTAIINDDEFGVNLQNSDKYQGTSNFINSLSTNEFEYNGFKYIEKFDGQIINPDFKGLDVEDENAERNPFVESSDPVVQRIANSISNRTQWIQSNFFDGVDLGKDVIRYSNDGHLMNFDNTYRDNSGELWKTDYSIMLQSGGFKADNPLSGFDDFLVNYNTLTDEKEKLISVCNFFFYGPTEIKNGERVLKFPLKHETPLGYIATLYENYRNQTVLSQTDLDTLDNFLTNYAVSNIQVINDILNSNDFLDADNRITPSQKSALFEIIGKRYELNVFSVDTFKNEGNTDFTVLYEELNSYLQDIFDNYLPPQQSKNDDSNNGSNIKIKSDVKDNNIKLAAYKDFREFYDRWISGDQDYFDGRPMIDFFRFVDRANRDIGDKVIVNFEGVAEYMEKNPSKSLFQVVQKLFSDNKFVFFPIQSFMTFDDSGNSGNTWSIEDIFEPQTQVAARSSPAFTGLYAGGESSFLGSRGVGKNGKFGDSFSLCTADSKIPKDLENGFVEAFVIPYGDQNNYIFTKVSPKTDGAKKSREYYQAIDNIANYGQNPAQALKLGQNLLNVYELYSYNIEVEMMGNVMVQPMQYVCLKGMGIFDGTYMILGVSHNITPNDIMTSFNAVRVPRVTVPKVTDYVTTIRRAYDTTLVSQITSPSSFNEDSSDGQLNSVEPAIDVVSPSQPQLNTLSFTETINNI